MKASTLAPATDARAARAADREWDGLTRDDLMRAYRTMLLSRRLDDKEIQLKNQSRIFFQISGAGHEAVAVAAGMHLRAGYDWFYPYYRDRALCLQLGMTPLEMLLGAVGVQGRSELRRPADALALGPQGAQHSVTEQPDRHPGAATPSAAARPACIYQRVAAIPDREHRSHPDEIVYMSIGDGATSEGEFWESLNTVCTRQVPILIVVQDNGYAISVPVEVQTPGGDIAKLVASFPQPRGHQVRRHRLPRQLSRDGPCRGPHPEGAQAGAGAREGHAPVLALALRR